MTMNHLLRDTAVSKHLHVTTVLHRLRSSMGCKIQLCVGNDLDQDGRVSPTMIADMWDAYWEYSRQERVALIAPRYRLPD